MYKEKGPFFHNYRGWEVQELDSKNWQGPWHQIIIKIFDILLLYVAEH